MLPAIDRSLSDRLNRAGRHFAAIVLTGARQTGKTTLVRTVFPGHRYVTLDLPSEAAAADADPSGFFARHPPPLIIDEVQYAPQLFRHLKARIDSGDHGFGAFVLTGSQKFVLMQRVAESLAGRVAVLELESLSVAELRAHEPSAARAADPIEVTFRGLMPALWKDPDLPRAEFWSSYVATYLERDLRQSIAVGNLRQFETFLRLCAARGGATLNRADLARDAGISPKTADAWLSALEASNQISLLPPWFANIGKRLVKAPKLYLNDPGLAVFLIGADRDAVAQSVVSGALWETVVYAEIRKSLATTASARQIFYYRDSDGGEIDFVVADGGRLDLVECKAVELPGRNDATALLRIGAVMEKAAGVTVRSRTVACRGAVAHPLADEVVARDGLMLEL